MQQQELQIKGQDLQRKVQKDMTDAQLKQEQIQTERMRIAVQRQADNDKLDRQQSSEGFRTAADLHKHEQQLDNQRKLQAIQQEIKARQKKGD
jgi:hypothetical protein